MRDGMHALIGGGQRQAFYDVFARTMRTLGTPTLPASFFDAVARRFPGRVEFGVVYTGNRAVAAGCGIVWRDEIELHWAGALREFGKSAPNMLLYWSFMHHAIARGVRTFNFGRCTAGSGTHAFKRQWGGNDTPLPWISWSKRDVTATPTPDKPVFKFAAACWRRLPLGIANVVGPRIARCLP
jgi:serine/alanine adding enzyme